LQETLIISPCQFRITGFKQVSLHSTSSSIRGLCTLIRNDFNYSTLDCNAFSHASVELLGIQLHCSLDKLHIFNIYRPPNSNTSSSFYSNLFAFALINKYVLFVGDFNVHYSDWEDHRTDSQGEHISWACEAFHLVIINDGSPTFLSSSSSVIDLSIKTSRSLVFLVNLSTTQDLHDSDHFPVRITVRSIYPSVFWYSYKHRFSASQLSLLPFDTWRIQIYRRTVFTINLQSYSKIWTILFTSYIDSFHFKLHISPQEKSFAYTHASPRWPPFGHKSIEHEPFTANSIKPLDIGHCGWWCPIDPCPNEPLPPTPWNDKCTEATEHRVAQHPVSNL